MKRSLLALFLIFSLLLTGCNKTDPVDDKAAIEALIAQLFAAVKAGDMDGTRALLAGEHFSDETESLLPDYTEMPGDLPAVLLDSIAFVILDVSAEGDAGEATIYMEYFDPYLFSGRLLTYLTERMETDPDLPTDQNELIDYLLAIDEIREENMTADEITCYFIRTADGWKVDLDRLFADYYAAFS